MSSHGTTTRKWSQQRRKHTRQSHVKSPSPRLYIRTLRRNRKSPRRLQSQRYKYHSKQQSKQFRLHVPRNHGPQKTTKCLVLGMWGTGTILPFVRTQPFLYSCTESNEVMSRDFSSYHETLGRRSGCVLFTTTEVILHEDDFSSTTSATESQVSLIRPGAGNERFSVSSRG